MLHVVATPQEGFKGKRFGITFADGKAYVDDKQTVAYETGDGGEVVVNVLQELMKLGYKDVTPREILKMKGSDNT